MARRFITISYCNSVKFVLLEQYISTLLCFAILTSFDFTHKANQVRTESPRAS